MAKKRPTKALSRPPVEVVARADGRQELNVRIAELGPPDVSYFANTAACVRRGGIVALTFGQLEAPGLSRLQNYVSVDLGLESARTLQQTFGDNFRTHLRASAEVLGPMAAYPTREHDSPLLRDAGVYYAHIGRAVVGLDLGVIEFHAFSIGPQGGEPVVVPVIRIEAHANLLHFIVESLDAVLETPVEGGVDHAL